MVVYFVNPTLGLNFAGSIEKGNCAESIKKAEIELLTTPASF